MEYNQFHAALNPAGKQALQSGRFQQQSQNAGFQPGYQMQQQAGRQAVQMAALQGPGIQRGGYSNPNANFRNLTGPYGESIQGQANLSPQSYQNFRRDDMGSFYQGGKAGLQARGLDNSVAPAGYQEFQGLSQANALIDPNWWRQTRETMTPAEYGNLNPWSADRAFEGNI